VAHLLTSLTLPPCFLLTHRSSFLNFIRRFLFDSILILILPITVLSSFFVPQAVEVLSIRLTTIALAMAREGEMGKESESEREERKRGREKGRERGGSYANNSPQHTPHTSNSNSNSTAHTAHRSEKLTEHKWDLELSRRKLLLLYYLVRGQTFNR
jgi:hypothetical protein